MNYTHACEQCGEEYNKPYLLKCFTCHGELLEQTALELEEVEG